MCESCHLLVVAERRPAEGRRSRSVISGAFLVPIGEDGNEEKLSV